MSKAVFTNDSYETFSNKTADSVPLQIITGQTATDPVVLTVAGHGIVSGRVITISANTTTTPLLNGEFIATVIDADTFSIPVAVTVAGSDGFLQTEQGTVELPRHVTYYARNKTLISSITIGSPAIVTTVTPHGFTTGNYVYVIGTDSTPSLNGGRIVTVLSATTFSVGVDTTVVGSTGNLCLEQDANIRKDIIIDGYQAVSGDPIFKGNLNIRTRYNSADGRFDPDNIKAIQQLQRTNDLSQLPIIDTRFASINLAGHTTNLSSTLGDINDTGNFNWLMPATATTLSVVSTSASDTFPAGAGLQEISLNGLNQTLDEIGEIVSLSGTTPVVTSLSYRSMHLATAIACGNPGSGAVGRIDIRSVADATVWGTFSINDTAAETGRFVVPNLKKFLLTATILNSGPDGNMTLKSELTKPGICPFSIGEAYIGSNFDTSPLPSQFFESGWLFKFRGFTNSGSPASRKINTSLFGVLALATDWDTLLIPI